MALNIKTVGQLADITPSSTERYFIFEKELTGSFDYYKDVGGGLYQQFSLSEVSFPANSVLDFRGGAFNSEENSNIEYYGLDGTVKKQRTISLVASGQYKLAFSSCNYSNFII